MCKLSIITVNYNNAEGLKATLHSVLAQSSHEFEHIIIDGGSTDGSVEIIREYESLNCSSVQPLTIIWTSEKDKGIYDAMNKGVLKASGDYLYFLNSGDCLASENVVRQMYEQIDGSDFIIGRVNSFLNGVSIGYSPILKERDLSMYHMFLHGISHQSTLIKRSVQLKSLYDTSAQICADWKFFVQAITLNGASVRSVDVVFADYDRSGISSKGKEIIQERLEMLPSILPYRIASDYQALLPHYYEVVRIEWLLQHPFWYRMYRAWTTLGRKLLKR